MLPIWKHLQWILEQLAPRMLQVLNHPMKNAEDVAVQVALVVIVELQCVAQLVGHPTTNARNVAVHVVVAIVDVAIAAVVDTLRRVYPATRAA
jgi:hypothetical protein